jgi:cyclopropane fatty-acyl-phospholipid synthase-like methyltransferase
MNFVKKYYLKIFPNFTKELEKQMKGCHSVLDIGCGSNSPIKYIKNRPYCVGVDGFKPSISRSKKQKIHNKYIQLDINKIDQVFDENSYDCVIALDLIEHFTKDEGTRLLKIMEKIARKKVIIFTPNGFVPQGEFENNPWQVHKSGWTPNEMKSKGYLVTGIAGIKALRNNLSEIKYRPHFFWRIISDITQLFTKKNPKFAFSILCEKKMTL